LMHHPTQFHYPNERTNRYTTLTIATALTIARALLSSAYTTTPIGHI
jgi:hypothetical protein